MLKFADTVDLNLDMVFGEDMMMMAPDRLFIFVACKALKPFLLIPRDVLFLLFQRHQGRKYPA